MKKNTIHKDLKKLVPEFFKHPEQAKKILDTIMALRPKVDLRKEFRAELRGKIAEKGRSVEEERSLSKKRGFILRYSRQFATGGLVFAALAVVLTFTLSKKGLVSPDIALQKDRAYQVEGGDKRIHQPLERRADPISPGENSGKESPVVSKEKADSNKQAVTSNSLDADDEYVMKEEAEVMPATGLEPEAEAIVVEDTIQGAPTPSVSAKKSMKGLGLFFNKTKSQSQSVADSTSAEPEFNTESYNLIYENDFLDPMKSPLSTFSIDVDTASYANMRRYINGGSLPPKDAVRIEELINYFDYTYKQPVNGGPFSVTTELGETPWNKDSKLLLIGIKGKTVAPKEKPASNLVFLIDSSGSMSSPEKLGLLKQSFKMMVQKLGKKDRVSIVTYAGSAGLVLPPTRGDKKQTIMAALDKLEAGGATAGGEGINLAYAVAEKNFKKNGNNRVILATDGDFNIGQSSDAELVRLIEAKRDKGVFISVLGFGMGNYKDSKMEQIADKGNGNYFYIDTVFEAKKVMVREMDSMLFTIAKDVKIQVEFNPAYVKEYRLIGYENRTMKAEDFDNDKKDAGEIGAGHTVTALYEIVPVSGDKKGEASDLKYQETSINQDAKESGELGLVKIRYKKPDGDKSTLITQAVKADDQNVSDNFYFASAVAEFGMILRDSKYKGQSSIKSLEKRAEAYKGEDEFGYRGEFIQLVKKAKMLTSKE